MSVKLKEKKEDVKIVGMVNFGKEDYVAVEGLKGSYFEGKVKVVHKIQAEKMGKLVKVLNAQLEEVVNKKRVVTDVD